MFRTTSVVLGSALMALLASCSGATPTSPMATADLSDESRAVAAQAVTASSACTISTSPEFTVTVSWSRLPVERVVLWHSLLNRSYTHTLNHQMQKGTFTIRLDFEPVLAVYYDREGAELVRQSCSGV
jgi:hypothetical protein